MHLTITVKVEASSREELIEHFASRIEALKSHFEQLKAEEMFGPPAEVDLRYLIVGGGYKPKAAERVEVADAE